MTYLKMDLMNFLSADLMHNLDNPQLADQPPLQSTAASSSNVFQENIFSMEIPGSSASSSSSNSSLNAIGSRLPVQKAPSYADPFEGFGSNQFVNKSASASADNLLFNSVSPMRSRSQSGSVYPMAPIGTLPSKPLDAANFQSDYFQMAKLMAEINALAPMDAKNGLAKVQVKTLSNDKYKTEFCDQIKQRGFCQYGDKCQFAHSRNELREKPRHPKYKTKVCNTFRDTGYCKYGKRCTFIHPTAEKPQSTNQSTLTALLQNLQNQQQQRSAMQSSQSANFICSNPLNIPSKIRHDSIGMDFSLSPSSFANSFNSSAVSSHQDRAHQRLSVFRSLSCSDK